MQTAGANWEIKVSADGKITCGGTSNIKSSHHLETADKIDMNGPPAAQAGSAETAHTPKRSPQAEPWAGHENYDPSQHTPLKTDADPKALNVIQPTGTTGAGTTSTTVATTAKDADEKTASNDTMKKDCSPFDAGPT